MKSASPRPWLVIAGISGALGVVLGAVSAHLADPAMAERLATAVRYLMWHGLALLAVAWLSTVSGGCGVFLAEVFLVLGQILFCGSLIISALTGNESITMVAPLGGAAFIVGWLCLGVAGWRFRACR